ncbi:hypothetical protein NDU88_005378 [Pleurodeles waltl]|uniref:Uncharacterized protein n=1 Tax=Pleurodeles waltl TaxID=8319 RepID=A0AAV7TTU5_PLEWA|nr:hypothetical protein NDU88_005378 [Pleurodeles waltl]
MKALADLRVRGRVSLWAVLSLKQQVSGWRFRCCRKAPDAGSRHLVGRSPTQEKSRGMQMRPNSLSGCLLVRGHVSLLGCFAHEEGCVARLGGPLLREVGKVGSLRSPDAGSHRPVGRSPTQGDFQSL